MSSTELPKLNVSTPSSLKLVSGAPLSVKRAIAQSLSCVVWPATTILPSTSASARALAPLSNFAVAVPPPAKVGSSKPFGWSRLTNMRFSPPLSVSVPATTIRPSG
jgi:hypothetical protein